MISVDTLYVVYLNGRYSHPGLASDKVYTAKSTAEKIANKMNANVPSDVQLRYYATTVQEFMNILGGCSFDLGFNQGQDGGKRNP